MVRITTAAIQRKRHQPRTAVQYLLLSLFQRQDLSGRAAHFTNKVFAGNAITVTCFLQQFRQFILNLFTYRDDILVGNETARIGKRKIQLVCLIRIHNRNTYLTALSRLNRGKGNSLFIPIFPVELQFIEISIGISVFQMNNQLFSRR